MYTDALNFVATTTNRFEFLHILLHQSHLMISIKATATINIPKHSDFNDLYMYAKELNLHVVSHALEQRSFSIKETILMFLSHVNNPCYKLAVKECEATWYHPL